MENHVFFVKLLRHVDFQHGDFNCGIAHTTFHLWFPWHRFTVFHVLWFHVVKFWSPQISLTAFRHSCRNHGELWCKILRQRQSKNIKDISYRNFKKDMLNKFWLVVSNPLKNMSQLEWLFPIYGKIKVMFQSPPNQNCSELTDFCGQPDQIRPDSQPLSWPFQPWALPCGENQAPMGIWNAKLPW